MRLANLRETKKKPPLSEFLCPTDNSRLISQLGIARTRSPHRAKARFGFHGNSLGHIDMCRLQTCIKFGDSHASQHKFCPTNTETSTKKVNTLTQTLRIFQLMKSKLVTAIHARKAPREVRARRKKICLVLNNFRSTYCAKRAQSTTS